MFKDIVFRLESGKNQESQIIESTVSSNQATFGELNQDLANGYMDKLDKAKVALIRVN